MIATGITSGHLLLSDWLFLIAAVLFGIIAICAALQRADPTRGAALPLGLTLVAVGWLVL